MTNKLVSYIRGKFGRKKPFALSIEDWQEFYQQYKREQPKTYFFCETVPKIVGKYYRSYVKFPITKVYDWFYYRLFDRYHVVRLDIDPGYYDKDIILLHANFTILKQYVEHELGWMQLITMTDKNPLYKKYRIQRKLTGFMPFRLWFHSKELGIQYLQERITSDPTEGFDPESLNEPFVQQQIEQLKDQISTDTEILNLYLWWEDVYKQRESVYDKHSDDSLDDPDMRKEFEKRYGMLYLLNKKFKEENPEWYAKHRDQMDAVSIDETSRHIENNKALERLIAIKDTLWT